MKKSIFQIEELLNVVELQSMSLLTILHSLHKSTTLSGTKHQNGMSLLMHSAKLPLRLLSLAPQVRHQNLIGIVILTNVFLR